MTITATKYHHTYLKTKTTTVIKITATKQPAPYIFENKDDYSNNNPAVSAGGCDPFPSVVCQYTDLVQKHLELVKTFL